MDTIAFKKLIKPYLDTAIEANGGLEQVRRVYRSMPAIIDFIAGWVTRDFVAKQPTFTNEEVRRIYDLVRLAIDTESTTS